MVLLFWRNPNELSLIFTETLDFTYQSHHHRLDTWNLRFFTAVIITQISVAGKGTPLRNCFVFVDGTVLRICRLC